MKRVRTSGEIQFRIRPELRPKLACARMDGQFVWSKWVRRRFWGHQEAAKEIERLNREARSGSQEGGIHVFEFRLKPTHPKRIPTRNGGPPSISTQL
jgi:hypothetical protein